jgi:hypothetical protein
MCPAKSAAEAKSDREVAIAEAKVTTLEAAAAAE